MTTLRDRPSADSRARTGSWRRLRWRLAIIAVVAEVVAFVAWRLWLRRRGR